MKKMNLKIKKWQYALAAMCLQTLSSTVAFGQLKINSLSEVTSKAKEGSDSMIEMAKYVIGAVLIIALVFTLWQIAQNNPKAKEHGVAWIVAIIFALIGLMII